MDRQPSRSVPETPFGQRLRAARKMAGLSMEDLARKLGGVVTKQAIGKYETGRMMPSPEVLGKLVEVLNAATWGASPLRLTDADRDEAVVLHRELPLLMEPAFRKNAKFRRAGLLARLRDRGGASGRPDRWRTDHDLLSSAVNMVEPAETPEGVVAGKTQVLAVVTPAVLGEEGFAPLAARRERFMSQWQADAGWDRVRFREGERLSVKTAEALRYRIAERLQKYLELESVLGLEAPFRNPIAGRRPGSAEEVESAAAEVRERWELGTAPIMNLLGLLEDKGIKVCEMRGLEGFEGLSGAFGPVPFVAVGMENPADRVRFTAAHELGHLLCGFPPGEDREGECHAFGAAFLLPRPALEKLFRPARRKVTLGDLGEIKETYGISLQAIMYRAHGLGCVSDRQLRSFRETLREKGWLVEEPVAYRGPERATRFRRLLHYAVSANILDVTRAAEMAGVTAEEMAQEIGEIF
jgi:Zn-dependent peptidase ImmA (M78 family)/transcriptional regulator with XRE-family HTH domain